MAPVPSAMADIREGDYRLPSGTNPDAANDANITILQNNSNAIDEYTANTFGGAMKGSLIIGRNGGGNLHRITLNPDGSLNTYEQNWISGLGGNILGVSCNGNSDPFPGTIWAASFNGKIKVFEPQGTVVCLYPGDPGYDPAADNDLDGFSNQDEDLNGTDMCSAASQPNDFDGDKISDLVDLDDDGDGILDANDPFQMGAPFDLPVVNELFSDQLDLKGYLGLGLTGLMNNGDPNPNYLNWLDDPEASNTDVDDIYGGAVGGMTIYHGTGDVSTNTQEKAFQYGVNVDISTDTFVVAARMLPPFHAHSASEYQGIYIGNGSQDNFLKLVLSGSELRLQGEKAGVSLGTLQSLNIGSISGNLELYFEVNPIAGSVQALYSLDDGLSKIKLGGLAFAEGATLNAIQNPSQALAVGMIGHADSDDGFASNWDFLNVEGKPLSPPQNVIFRVNCGGATIAAIDGGLDWLSDGGRTLAADNFTLNTGNTFGGGATSWDPDVPNVIEAFTPFGIFQSERWDPSGAPEMKYTFDVQSPGDYAVRLYFRDAYSGTNTPGSRVFTVVVDGNSFAELVDVDITAAVGHQVGTVIEVPVNTSDNLLDIEFIHYVQNPLVSGIEILSLPPKAKVQAKLLLEGPWNGNEMSQQIAPQLPNLHPFTGAPWLYDGLDNWTSLPANTVDWVLVEARDKNDPSIILQRKAGLVRQDGVILDMDGGTGVTFVGLQVDSLYVALRHRSHLGVMNASPVALSDLASVSLDFSDPGFAVYGTNSRRILNGKALLWSGDANYDGVINAVDYNQYWLPQNGQPYQYFNSRADFNLDGVINAVDMINFWRVNNSRIEQLP
ncbi:MAG: malectin domain-containing carbohydrate-binding protein [Bacteroidota bacterium]